MWRIHWRLGRRAAVGLVLVGLSSLGALTLSACGDPTAPPRYGTFVLVRAGGAPLPVTLTSPAIRLTGGALTLRADSTFVFVLRYDELTADTAARLRVEAGYSETAAGVGTFYVAPSSGAGLTGYTRTGAELLVPWNDPSTSGWGLPPERVELTFAALSGLFPLVSQAGSR